VEIRIGQPRKGILPFSHGHKSSRIVYISKNQGLSMPRIDKVYSSRKGTSMNSVKCVWLAEWG
jgi:hypothetical protein